uniref:Uncharacterized protein n=1 Tax=Meloidogyne enterolobii TaxID=390850 RepID=A0A6V7WWS3_MELEN|nr:unnamed protein product [Meloidogyne enterolobii]
MSQFLDPIEPKNSYLNFLHSAKECTLNYNQNRSLKRCVGRKFNEISNKNFAKAKKLRLEKLKEIFYENRPTQKNNEIFDALEKIFTIRTDKEIEELIGIKKSAFSKQLTEFFAANEANNDKLTDLKDEIVEISFNC